MAVNGESRHRRTQAERSAATRAALLAAARELFTAQGYAATGREQVVERAGVTRGALYHHFAGKDALFRAVYEAVEQDVVAAVTTRAMKADDPAERLRLGCQAFLDAALEPDVQRIVLLDGPAVLDRETHQQLSETYGLGIMRAALEEVAATGRLRPAGGSIEPMAHMLLAALHAAAALVAHAERPRKARAEVGATLDALLASFT